MLPLISTIHIIIRVIPYRREEITVSAPTPSCRLSFLLALSSSALFASLVASSLAQADLWHKPMPPCSLVRPLSPSASSFPSYTWERTTFWQLDCLCACL